MSPNQPVNINAVQPLSEVQFLALVAASLQMSGGYSAELRMKQAVEICAFAVVAHEEHWLGTAIAKARPAIYEQKLAEFKRAAEEAAEKAQGSGLIIAGNIPVARNPLA